MLMSFSVRWNRWTSCSETLIGLSRCHRRRHWMADALNDDCLMVNEPIGRLLGLTTFLDLHQARENTLATTEMDQKLGDVRQEEA